MGTRATKDLNSKMLRREHNRFMLAIYDLLIFVAVYIALFVFSPSNFENTQLNFLTVLSTFTVPAVCIFGMRFVFKSYKQILRYGNMGALARFLIADVTGGIIYLIINQYFSFLPRTTFLRAFSLVTADYSISTAAKIIYYYLYSLAEKDNLLGKALREFLRFIGGVVVDDKNPGTVRSPFTSDTARVEQPINEIQRVARQFLIHGDITNIEQMNAGYINRTYRVETLSKAGHVHMYTLQRINTNVFPDVDALMDNFMIVSTHLHDKFLLPGHGAKGSIQSVKTTVDGKSYLKDDSGCWRMMTHFQDVYSLDIPDTADTFYQAGRAFGSFIKEMSDVPPESIKTVIPNFHNTYSRYLDLEKAIENDPVGRVKEVVDEINFIRERKDRFSLISDALESGRIPVRICHNDCNLNNILFDNKTKLPVAIIDLDTVMQSTPLYDFGDSMRIGTNTAKDDEKDLSKVSCSLTLYEAYARGYLEACGSMLTKEELKLLPYACLIITSEDGIRFLMDHINGDTYYHIFYTGQNLDRSRTQLALLADMEKKLPEIKEILRNIYKELGLEADIE